MAVSAVCIPAFIADYKAREFSGGTLLTSLFALRYLVTGIASQPGYWMFAHGHMDLLARLMRRFHIAPLPGNGSALQQPLFVVLGLAMFDIGAIDFSKFSSKIRFDGAKRGSPMLAFAMGAVAALLAGACVAPVVIQVVVFASDQYAKGQPIALALLFVLGLGMALPWPIAGAGLSKLPKPGAWMNKVKYAFGVFILVMAGYYGYLTYEIVSNRWVDKADVEASTAEKAKEGWFTSLDDGLRAAQASGQPVLVDMWATWCKNCLTMDKTTLADARVKAALDGYVKIKFQAEDPEAPGTKEVMQKFGAVGLPAYGVLKAK